MRYADSDSLNKAMAEVSRAAMTAPENTEAFADRVTALSAACGNMYDEDRIKMLFTQGLPEILQTDWQEYNLQYPTHTLQQLAHFGNDKHKMAKVFMKPQATPPKVY